MKKLKKLKTAKTYSKDETSIAFKRLNKACFHLANDVLNSSSLISDRKKDFWDIKKRVQEQTGFIYSKKTESKKQSLKVHVNFKDFVALCEHLSNLDVCPSELNGKETSKKSSKTTTTRRKRV
tara:strand:+ start:3457 stop:3825 length:369 start_codon:yes stop_codon:yes gene_type:complete